MKRKHVFRSLLAAVLALCLFAGDMAPAMAAQKVTQAQIDALKSEAKDLDAKQKEIQKKVNALNAEIKNNTAKKNLLDSKINILTTEIANTANDTYLRTSGEKAGIASYSQVCDLLVNWHIQEVVLPSIAVEESHFDPYDKTQVDISDIR